MTNEIVFIIHTLIIILLSLGALRIGEHALIALLCLLGVLSNLLIVKQVTLFGFAVTCSDVYAVGSILCLNLLQEYFGKKKAFQAIWASFFCLVVFLAMSQLHLWYTPNLFDITQEHYQAILGIMPRITIASIISYLTVQLIDTGVYSLLQTSFLGKFFTLRTIISLVFSQTLDTVLFSFLGLYGIVGSITHIIIVSLAVKLLIIGLSAPLIGLTKKMIQRNTENL